MDQPGVSPSELLALAAVLLAIAVIVAWVLRSNRAAGRRQARLTRAAQAETRAASVLLEAGFEILEHQPSCVWTLLVEGAETVVESRGDFLVRRHGRLLIADAKSGTRAINPALPATRRQLLEYLLVFEVDGVLVVDAAAAKISEVEFPQLQGRG